MRTELLSALLALTLATHGCSADEPRAHHGAASSAGAPPAAVDAAPREPRVDEEAAVAAAREVAAIEGELKIARLRLMVRMKNRLTETQQAELEQLR